MKKNEKTWKIGILEEMELKKKVDTLRNTALRSVELISTWLLEPRFFCSELKYLLINDPIDPD